MENMNNTQKEPQDSIRKNPNLNHGPDDKRLIEEKSPQDNMANEKKDNMIEEENQKLASESIQEAVKEKSNQIINFSKELDNLLAYIDTVWQKSKDGFDECWKNNVSPKIHELLKYPCITAIQEKVLLIYKFLCKYFYLRKDHLKEISENELMDMYSFLFDFNNKIFSPESNDNPNCEIIDDRYFYHIFKELLPQKEVENSYGNIRSNCMFKYIIEFLIQSGFFNSFIDNVLTRDFMNQLIFCQMLFFSHYILSFCDKDFLVKNNYNIRIIKICNSKIDYYLSDKNPLIKNDIEMSNIGRFFSLNFIYLAMALFGYVLDELLSTNNIDCEIFSITVFKFTEFFMKNPKINMKMWGVHLTGELCEFYLNFFHKYNDYNRSYNEIDKTYTYITNCAILYLKKINIFDLIFGENIHEGLIQRSYNILSFMYRRGTFTLEQIQVLWNLSQTKHQSISDNIISLFGRLLPEFSNENCNIILNIVLKMDYKDVKETTLQLLQNFFIGNEKRELLLDILFKFSNELSYEKGLSKNIIFKSRAILVRLLFNKNYTEDLVKYMKNCLFYINKFYLTSTYSSTLIQILEYFDIEKKQKNNNLKEIFKKFDNKIENFGMMISYLDEKYDLFPIYINYLINVIKLFIFFNQITQAIVSQIDEGNFNYEELLNIDNLYKNYQNCIKQNMNFYFSNDKNNDEDSMDIDFEGNNNNVINIKNKTEEENLINFNETDYDNYIKNIIKDYILFFRETFLSNNILPSNEDIKRNIFGKLRLFFEKLNYSDCIKNILEMIYKNHVRANIHFKMNYLKFLYYIGKNIQNIDRSMEWYYNLLFDLFSLQINNKGNMLLLSNSNLESLIKEHINKSDYKYLPISAFNTVNIFGIYINEKKKIATYSPLINKYTDIKNIKEFYGFETIWRFYLLTKNEAIYQQALNVLINILELTSQDVENRSNFINYIFNSIEKSKNQIQNNQELKLEFIRNLKLISVINGTKLSKSIIGNNKTDNNKIELIIKNLYFSFNIDNNTSTISISKDTKVNDLKEYIINNIICTEKNLESYNAHITINNNAILQTDNNIEKFNIISTISNDNYIQKKVESLDDFKKMVYKTNILINYKNRVLKDGYTIADYNIKNGDNISILPGSGNYDEEYKPTEEDLKNGFEAIKLIFGDNLYFGEDVMKAAIIKHKGNSEEAGLYLTQPENVKNLQKEIEDKKKRVEQNEEEIMCLEQDKINILFDILNNTNDEEISKNIWQLFSEIKYPDSFIQKIISQEFKKVFEQDLNKMILSLKIINSIVFDDDFCKFNKLKKEEKNNWISLFIKDGNTIMTIFKVLSELNLQNHNHISQIIKIYINWFHKIILKIDELLKKEKGDNLGIKLLKQFNEENNNNINNNNIINKEEKNEKDTEKFEIVNKDEAIKFILILYEINGIESFYKILLIILNINIKEEDKQTIIQNIFEIILIYLILQPNSIPQITTIEKKNNALGNIVCNGKDNIIGKQTKNFIKALIISIYPLIDKKDIDTENNIFNVFCLSIIQKVMNGLAFNQQSCDLLGTLLNAQTNTLLKNSIDPLLNKLIYHVYDLSSKFVPYDNLSKQNIIFEIYIISSSVKFYKNNLKNYINKLFMEEKKDFIGLIYDCLFEITRDKNKIIPFKFSDELLRQYSFNLLTELITSDEKYLYQILPKVLTHHRKLKEIDINKIETPFDVNIRLPHEKLVGLRNFGCTCYLNSLLQQMFMIPSFRHDLFNNFKIEKVNSEELKFSVIYNMQITFQNLISGWMSPYPPIRFIKSFLSAFNGQPIQLGIMQDSDEFLSIVCDNLEKESKFFGKENFLENSFKGKISNEILSLEKEFPYYSQTEEPFYRITLDIKGHKSLEEALDAYIKGEILDGDNKYYVEKYQRKISIRKSCSLKKLGNEVIIHLKRFEYDFCTFTNNKLSDYLKFPLKINFKKWTRAFLRFKDNNISQELLNITKEEEQNLIVENMEYILTGILIHGGSNLESGHYYSFIMDQETGKWHQYNDNSISDYNIETDLEKECFGNSYDKSNQYGKTAYLLFYTNKKCFKNKDFIEKINVGEDILNDVFIENTNFLNMNIYTNIHYYNFIKEFSTFSSLLLEDEMYEQEQDSLTLNNNLKKDYYIFMKTNCVIKGDDDDNDNSIDESDNDDNNIVNHENFEQIYNKCKEEIEFNLKQEKKNKKNNKANNIYNKKSIVRLYFNYIFGIVLNLNNNSNLLCQALETLNNILKNNPRYSLWVLKQIEKNIDIFTELLFKYGCVNNELNNTTKAIFEFFQTIFDTIYSFEKDNLNIISEKLQYFVKDDKGKFIIVKENKSITMRLIRKLFCENLEKSRIEYARNSLFLIIFYNFVKNYIDVASICVDYLPTIISLITNNILSYLKSETNPNYLMGGATNYSVNNNYIMIFCDIILRCVTPGMENTKTYSPYYIGRRKKSEYNSSYIDFSDNPHLPKNWEKILSIEFFVNFVLYHDYSKSKEVICHLCYGDEKTSVKILSLVNEFIKTINVPLPFIERVFNNTLSVFELKDALEFIRLDTLFQLNNEYNSANKDNDIEQNYLLDYYNEEREKHMNLVLYMLYNIGMAIEKYNIISNYFEKHKNKLEWIKLFLVELQFSPNIKEEFLKNNTLIINQHPDLLQVIQKNIIKRFGIDID